MKVKLFSEVADQMTGRGGWQRGDGDTVFINPKLGSVTHVAICKDDGTPMWDQFIHFEPIGAISLPVNSKGEVGLVSVERPTFRIGTDQQTFPALDLDNLGCPSLEFPRGFPKKGEIGAQTAKREGEEELGSPITNVGLLGHLTPNTTFHPHRIPVYLVGVDNQFKGTTPPDVNEKILNVQWMTAPAVINLMANGAINCAMTLGTWALYHAHLTRDRL